MPRNFRVRPMTLADIPAVQRFVHKWYPRSFQVAEGIGGYCDEDLREWIESGQHCLLTCEEYCWKGQDSDVVTQIYVVGFLICLRMSSGWRMLDGFFVGPNMRGKGAGKCMFETMEAWLRDTGARYLSSLVGWHDGGETDIFNRKVGLQPGHVFLWYGKQVGPPGSICLESEGESES